MRITYDPEANAVYISLRDGERSAVTEEIAPSVMVDLDDEGRAIGIEILGARQQLGENPLAVSLELVSDQSGSSAIGPGTIAAE
jgi:uncharacterized protein YuzE